MNETSFRDLPVLVTGGAGFIGSHLVDALLERGAKVRVLDNFATGRRENLAGAGDRVELIEDDLRDLDACRRACEGIELIFHQAALGSVPRSLEDPATTFAVNVQGTAHLFEAARREAATRRVVYASSSSVYGNSPVMPRREGEEGEPLSPYAASKQMDEQLARVFASAYGLEVVGLRYFNVYGPRQTPEGPYAAVIPCFFREALAGRPPLIHGDGEQTRDFTFVGDAVRANLLAAQAPAEKVEGRCVNVACGRRTSVIELARTICSLAGSGVSPRHGPPRPGDALHSLADLQLASSALGYQPRVLLSAGLEACRGAFQATGAPA